jgi:hypothetical protein
VLDQRTLFAGLVAVLCVGIYKGGFLGLIVVIVALMMLLDRFNKG